MLLTFPVILSMPFALRALIRGWLGSAARTRRTNPPVACAARLAERFFTWCDARGLALAELSPIAVATYIDEMHGRYRAPTIKQHLAAIRRLCDWLVIG